MKTLRGWIPALAAVWLCGCFQVEDDLTLQPDGSGKVKLSMHSSLTEDMVSMLRMSSPYGGGSAPMYPPVNEAEARHFFPPKDFTLKVEQNDAAEGETLVVEASFKDINRLLASPYGRAHQLALATNQGGALRLRALSGGATLARAAQMKAEGEMEMLAVPGIEDAQKKKGEMRFEFRVTLPNAVIAANGVRQNKTVTWGAERAKCKDDDEFASKLSGVLEATCSAEGLKFSPVTPPRLGLRPFGELSGGENGRRQRAARHQPDRQGGAVCALRATRDAFARSERAGRRRGQRGSVDRRDCFAGGFGPAPVGGSEAGGSR